jgi:hypothetical protein
MSPEAAIGMLDRQLAEHGEDVILRHTAAGGVQSSETVRAFVRGYKPNEIAGEVEQGDELLIISPTGLGASAKKGDRVSIGSRTRTIASVPVELRLGGQVVRIELRVNG